MMLQTSFDPSPGLRPDAPAFRRFVLAAAILLWAGHSAADTATVSEDTNINLTTPTQVNGAATTVSVRNSGKGGVRHGFVRFDLSGFPSGTQVAQATLRMWAATVAVPGPVTLHVVLGPWSEATLSAATVPPVDAPFDTLPVVQAGKYATLDLTSVVQQWLDASVPNYGLALLPTTSDPVQVDFDSKENTGTSHPMELEIIPVGPPGPEGPQGPEGAMGPVGPEGPAGASPFVLNGSDAFYTAGNIGIGTSLPARRLHVDDTAGDQTALFARSSMSAPGDQNLILIGKSYTAEEAAMVLFRWDPDPGKRVAAFGTAGHEVLFATNGQRIGIGTVSPGATLDVNGDARVTGRLSATSLGNELAVIAHQPPGTTAAFDLCYLNGGLIWVGGSSGGNQYQTSILYHYMAGSTMLVLARAFEAGTDLGAHNFVLERIGGGSSGSATCQSWYHRVQMRATGWFNEHVGTAVVASMGAR